MKHGLGAHVEILLVTTVNMLQIMNLETLMQDVGTTLESTHLSGTSNVVIRIPSLYDPIMLKQMDAHVSNLNNDTDDNEHCDGGSQLVKLNGDEYEFGNTKLENLVLTKGPHQILQRQVDDFMENEIIDVNNYVDWIKWVSNAKERKHAIFESRSCAKVNVLPQVHQIDNSGSHNNCNA
jgi:hypothetical protein